MLRAVSGTSGRARPFVLRPVEEAWVISRRPLHKTAYDLADRTRRTASQRYGSPKLEVRRYASSAVATATASTSSNAQEPGGVVSDSIPRDFGKNILRDYQVECVQECLSTLASGQTTRIGVSSPTGSGKTTMFSALLSAIPSRNRAGQGDGREANQVLVIVSSIALATQTARAISKAYPGLHIELEQGTAFHSTGLADVTVATAQTLSRSRARLEKFNPDNFKAVIVDEAHHAAAPSYISILSYFDPQVGVPLQKRTDKDSEQSSGIPIIGFSATFARHDGIALGKVFQRIVYHKDFLEMVNAKWLSPVRFTSVRTSLDLASVPTSAASHDFRTSALGELMNTRALNQVIVRTWLDRAGTGPRAASSSQAPVDDLPTARRVRRSTLVFAVNVAHVIDLTQAFRDAGIDARYVHGGQRPNFREEVIRAFERGEFPVLVNCAVLTEGADIPPIDCLILARPTRSRNVFMQMLGRGLRLSPNTDKDDCLVLDVVGATERGVMCTPTLFGLDISDVIEDLSLEELRQRAKEKAESEAASEPGLEMDSEADSDPFEVNTSPRVAYPRKVTYIDYDSPEALQAAMLGHASSFDRIRDPNNPNAEEDGDTEAAGREAYVPIERLSSNAWVDCGGGIFVLEIPPGEGHVKIRRLAPTEGDDADLAHAASSKSNIDDEESQGPVPDAEEEAKWVAHYYPRNPSVEDLQAATKTGPIRLHRRGPSYILRPRLILHAATIDAAIRGADTYVERSVLRGAITRVALCRRRAEWRSKQATGPQKELLRRRLGHAKVAVSSNSRRKSTSGAVGGVGPSAGTEDVDPLAGLTKGQASLILARLTHGAKARWLSAAKAHNRDLKDAERRQKKAEEEADKAEKRIKKMAEREKESERRRGGLVQVGDL
ncbi:hypothetical protein A4X09_0g2281 [Tilletia walkeri]|uniref:P-loop containing nucleoside triphosphate hydrolase protein n=1 Tax=Tilletia walkeri TaxID=117179 RepID=A0A8X7NCN8_9BASI|nr:hypothetical protein A4X09_0g2281 [Tilletia walkeri]